MFKRWQRKKKEHYGEPAIDANEVNEAEIDPIGSRMQGRYTGRLLNPDEVFYSETNSFANLSDNSNN